MHSLRPRIRRWAGPSRTATLATVLAAACLSAPAATFALTVPFSSLPHTTPAEAIAHLNAQRAANGIPGILTDDPLGDRGCWEFTNLYTQPAELMHRELPSQPGYTTGGDEAARHSNLGGAPGRWSRTENPFTGAPLHLTGLFSPGGGSVGYGETEKRWDFGLTCLGDGHLLGPLTPQERSGFYSYPGNGATEVDPVENGGESPFTPAEAAGIPAGTNHGPTIIPFSPVEADPEAASLIGPAGEPVRVSLLTSKTPAPPPHPADFPEPPTVGDFVVVPQPLRWGAAYTLTITWPSSGGPIPQVIHFTTATKQQQARNEECIDCQHGRIIAAPHGGHVAVSVIPAAGQTLTVAVVRGNWGCLTQGPRHCPPGRRRFFITSFSSRRIRRYRRPLSIVAPAGRGQVAVGVYLERFEAEGYQWQPSPLCSPVCPP
jgi:hypothetical protein